MKIRTTVLCPECGKFYYIDTIKTESIIYLKYKDSAYYKLTYQPEGIEVVTYLIDKNSISLINIGLCTFISEEEFNKTIDKKIKD